LVILTFGILVPLSGVATLYLQELKDIHEFLANLFLFFVVAHIVGVLSDRFFHGSKLIESMSIAPSKLKKSFVTIVILFFVTIGAVVGSLVDITPYEEWHAQKS